MNPEMRPIYPAEVHERAHNLAAESIDAALEPADARWLAAHMDACPECAAVAEEYRAIHRELRSLPMPEPPRDLWARTSAALDQMERGSSRRVPSTRRTTRPGNRPLISTALAVGFVVVAAAASLLVQSPIPTSAPSSNHPSNVAFGTASPGQPAEGPQGPLAVVNGTSYWIASDAGVYQIKGGTTECSATDGSCTVAGGTGQTLGSIASDTTVSAVIAPDATQAAVWTTDKVAIVPLAAQPSTVSLNQLTPRPTLAATPTASVPPKPSITAPAITPATSPSVAAVGSPSSRPVPSDTAATPVPTPTEAATVTPSPTASTTPAAVATAAASPQPTAILTGYEIVGHDPQFSPDGTEVAFSARPVDHSTGPDVFLWRAGQEQARAITSSHADFFAGWFGRRLLISEISTGGSSVDAAATASAEATGAAATPAGGAGTLRSISYVFDPRTETVLEIDRPMLLPVADPTGSYLVYWSGTVEFDPVTGLWQPGKGDLFFDDWSDLKLTPATLQPVATSSPSASASPTATLAPSPSVTPSATPSVSATPSAVPTEVPNPAAAASPQDTPATPAATASSSPLGPSAKPSPAQPALPRQLSISDPPGSVHAWIVRWDATGSHVAIWVADPGSARIGRLSLLSIDRTTGMVETNEPLFGADKVLANIAMDDGHLVYTSAVDGKTYLQAIPALPPSKASTPSPTIPGQLPSGSPSPAAPAPLSSDRPGS